jgi:hypothetical protein
VDIVQDLLHLEQSIRVRERDAGDYAEIRENRRNEQRQCRERRTDEGERRRRYCKRLSHYRILKNGIIRETT